MDINRCRLSVPTDVWPWVRVMIVLESILAVIRIVKELIRF